MSADRGALRLALWLVAVLGVQLLVLGLSADGVYSGSDAGGRAAAVIAGAEQESCDHDLGYWAAPWDPTARVHPMVNTLAVGERFVQPASILFVCAASPLVAAVGVDGALALSIAGVLAAAAGAWLLERAAGGSGTWSLVLVGLVGPVAFYGTDVWEHAPAVGCALLGTALYAWVVVVGRGGVSLALVSGLLWGLAVTLRTETALVAVALAVGFLVVAETRTTVLRAWRGTLVGVATGASVVVGDALVEAAVLGTEYRSSRAEEQASDALERASGWVPDAAATTVGLVANDSDWFVMGFGLMFVTIVFAVSVGVTGARLPRSIEWTLLAALGFFVMARLSQGAGFVPGLFAAAPVAVVGLWALRGSALPLLRAVALGATLCLPAVWFLQWRGNLIAQWGGRYVLLSGALLTVCGVVALGSHPGRGVRAALTVTAVAIGLLGIVWKVERSTIAEDVITELAALSCDEVLVITTPFIPREGGARPGIADGELADGCRFLSAAPRDLGFALEVARAAGADHAAVLTVPGDGDLLSSVETADVRAVERLELGSLEYERYEVDLTP